MALPKAAETDPVLLPFLTASDEEQAEAAVSELIGKQRDTIISSIVRSKLHVSLSPTDTSHLNQEALDLVTEVQTLLISGLRDLKLEHSTKAVRDFNGYVATVTFNACHQLLRRKYPRRFRLKNKLRYLLTHESKFALWESEKEWLCGFAVLRGSKLSTSATRELNELRDLEPPIEYSEPAGQTRQRLIDRISTIFEMLHGPVLFDEFVSLMIEQLQIKEDKVVAYPEPAQSGHESVNELESEVKLRELWQEICELPLFHRRALLLNLRDRHGADALELFLMSRVTTVRDMAKVLEFQPEEFSIIWNELPWDDLSIANHLGLTRQQIINLRQSARAKLARKMKLGR